MQVFVLVLVIQMNYNNADGILSSGFISYLHISIVFAFCPMIRRLSFIVFLLTNSRGGELFCTADSLSSREKGLGFTTFLGWNMSHQPDLHDVAVAFYKQLKD